MPAVYNIYKKSKQKNGSKFFVGFKLKFTISTGFLEDIISNKVFTGSGISFSCGAFAPANTSNAVISSFSVIASSNNVFPS